MGFWESIKQRYDIAFIGATFAIVFGLAFIFFTMVVSDWMFPGPTYSVGNVTEMFLANETANGTNAGN